MSDATLLYVSRPRQVEAIQWTGDVRAIDRSPFGGVVAWACDDEGEDLLLRAGKDGAQGWVPVPLGHWLVRNSGDPSDNWLVDPDHFAAMFDRAGGTTNADHALTGRALMAAQPLWRRVGVWLVVAVLVTAAVVVGRLVLANDDNGATWVPQVEIGEPLVCTPDGGCE